MARRMSSASSSTRLACVRSPEQSSAHTTTPPFCSMVRPILLITPPMGQPVTRMRLASADTGRSPASYCARRSTASASSFVVNSSTSKLKVAANMVLMSSTPLSAGGLACLQVVQRAHRAAHTIPTACRGAQVVIGDGDVVELLQALLQKTALLVTRHRARTRGRAPAGGAGCAWA